MIPAINNSHRFIEGTASTGCMQALRNFATRVKNAIAQFFQCILPCLFKKKGAPVLQTTVTQLTPQLTVVQTAPSTSPQQPVQTVQITAPATQERVTQAVTTVAAPIVQPQQPPAPIQPPITELQQTPAVVQSEPPVVHIPAEDLSQSQAGNLNSPIFQVNTGPRMTPVIDKAAQTLKDRNLLNKTLHLLKHNINELTQGSGPQMAEVKAPEGKDDEKPLFPTPELTKRFRRMWGMANIEIGQYLNLPKIGGQEFLPPSQRKGAALIVLDAIELLWPVIKLGLRPPASDFKTIFEFGLAKYQRLGSPENVNSQLEDVLKHEYISLVRAQIGRRNSIVTFSKRSPADQIINVLINNAQNKAYRTEGAQDMFAALLVAGEPADMPPVYGLFIKTFMDVDHSLHPPAVGFRTEIHLLDLYGGGMGTACLTQISRPALAQFLANQSKYSCIAFEDVQE